jgi:hypothetical protein
MAHPGHPGHGALGPGCSRFGSLPWTPVERESDRIPPAKPRKGSLQISSTSQEPFAFQPIGVQSRCPWGQFIPVSVSRETGTAARWTVLLLVSSLDGWLDCTRMWMHGKDDKVLGHILALEDLYREYPENRPSPSGRQRLLLSNRPLSPCSSHATAPPGAGS